MISPLKFRTPGAPTSGSSFRLGFLGGYVFIQKFFGGRDLGGLRRSFCSDAALLNIGQLACVIFADPLVTPAPIARTAHQCHDQRRNTGPLRSFASRR